MIVVADINAIWRIRPFDALAQLRPVTGLSPRRWGGTGPDCLAAGSPPLTVSRVGLPPGWASRCTSLSARVLLRRVRSVRAAGLIVTSPHYLSLARLAAREMPVYYYCSDDYSEYDGWGGKDIETKEAQLISHCTMSFFVSRVLAEKAVRVFRADPERACVCPNATGAEFLGDGPAIKQDELAEMLPRLQRPVVGVVGAINSRLDFELLLACAELEEVGTLLLVGPWDSGMTSPAWDALKVHPKCVMTGLRPHPEIPGWMRGIDVALIPYAETPLNRACSPMRLFDHLASGKPIVATSACDQVREFDAFLRRGSDRREVLDLVRKQCIDPATPPRSSEFLAGLTWENRAQLIASRL